MNNWTKSGFSLIRYYLTTVKYPISVIYIIQIDSNTFTIK